MHVDDPEGEKREEFFGQDLPESGSHAEVGRKRRDGVKTLAGDFVELQHGDAQPLRLDLEGGGPQRVAPAHGFVRARHDCGDGMGGGKRRKHFCGKIRRAHEDDLRLGHSFFRSLHFEV